MIEKEKKVAKVENASTPGKTKIPEENMVEPAPLPSKVEIVLPSANATKASIEKARARAEASTFELGIVLLGTAPMVACPQECFLAAGIGAAACTLYKAVRSI